MHVDAVAWSMAQTFEKFVLIYVKFKPCNFLRLMAELSKDLYLDHMFQLSCNEFI